MIRNQYLRLIYFSKPCLFSKSFVDCTNLFPNPRSWHSPITLSSWRWGFQFVMTAISDITESTRNNRNLFRNLHYVVFRPLNPYSNWISIPLERLQQILSPSSQWLLSILLRSPLTRICYQNQRTKMVQCNIQNYESCPSSINHSYKIFLRQNWTPWKQLLATNNLDIVNKSYYALLNIITCLIFPVIHKVLMIFSTIS